MLRFFESLVDPYTDYPETDRPPQQAVAVSLGLFATVQTGVFALTGRDVGGGRRGGDLADLVCTGRLVDLLSSDAPTAIL